MAGTGDNSSDSWLVTLKGFSEPLLKDVKSRLQRPLIARNRSPTIYWVPNFLARLNPPAYDPRFLYLGINIRFQLPWNDDPEFTTNHLLYHVQSILNRNKNRRFEDYLKAMYEMRDRFARYCMQGVEMDFDHLLQAVVSSCFILDILFLVYDGELTTTVDEVCATRLQYFWMDFLLIKNQIPFFVLQRVYDMVVTEVDDESQRYPSLVKLCLHFFSTFDLEINKLQRPPMESESIHHLLDLVHHSLLSSENPPKHSSSSRLHSFCHSILTTQLKNRFSWPSSSPSDAISAENNINPTKMLTIKPIPSARRLKDAGIKFKKKEAQGFSNICFNRHKGVLEIPYLRIDNNTQILLGNLVAWEQCHPETLNYFTGYAIFMDYIVTSTIDVDILLQSGIIEHTLGTDDKVASIFNGFSNNLVYKGDDGGHLPALCHHINEYCRDDFNIWWGKLMKDYFSSPWTIPSVIAAFTFFLLFLTQTFFAVFVYFRPP